MCFAKAWCRLRCFVVTVGRDCCVGFFFCAPCSVCGAFARGWPRIVPNLKTRRKCRHCLPRHIPTLLQKWPRPTTFGVLLHLLELPRPRSRHTARLPKMALEASPKYCMQWPKTLFSEDPRQDRLRVATYWRMLKASGTLAVQLQEAT